MAKWQKPPTCYVPKSIEFGDNWMVIDTIPEPMAFVFATVQDLEALRDKVEAEIARRKAEAEQRERIIADLAAKGIKYEPPTVDFE